MRTTLFVLAFLASASVAAAQVPSVPYVELRPMIGATLPTGPQRHLVDNAMVYGAQGALELKPTLHLVASFGFSPAHHSFASARDGVNVYQYDAGAEFNLVRRLDDHWTLKPFLGAGLGARTYDYAADLGVKSCFAGYGAVGTEFQRGVTALRVEARDYAYCYKYPDRDLSRTRNDVGLYMGLAYHIGLAR